MEINPESVHFRALSVDDLTVVYEKKHFQANLYDAIFAFNLSNTTLSTFTHFEFESVAYDRLHATIASCKSAFTSR